jgi:type IX secretion system PorP/SprF family membrane protein
MNGYAQTEPMYSQYMHNQLSINPAYAGNRESLQLVLFQRRQWVGMEGAPQTSSASINQSIRDHKMGWGLQLYDDRIGVEKASGANFMLSTKVRVSNDGYLSGGLSAGLMNYSIGLTSVTERFTPSDPAFYANLNKWMPNLGLGLFYNTDKFYAGVSIPNVIKSKLSTFDLIRSGLQKTNQYHVFITSGYVFELNEDVKIKPSAMLKMVSGAPTQIDLNTNVLLQNKLGLGLSYRTGDAIVSMVELQASERIKIGYAYDLSITSYKYYNNGSHELMLSFELSDEKAKVKSTRYF